MKKISCYVLCSVALCLCLSACGTKGPLYIPEQQYPQPAEKS